MSRNLALLFSLSLACGPAAATPDSGADVSVADTGSDAGLSLADRVRAARWTRVEGAPTVARGKQDDIFWLSPDHAFLASGPLGAVYETTDGGGAWTPVFNSSTALFRSVLFLDEMRGFVGNIGPGLSPSISDPNVLYRTVDGGDTWTAVTEITGDPPGGLCNFTAASATDLYAVGRANGPSHLLRSTDAGATWTSIDLSAQLLMAIDAHFVSPTEGVVAGMGPTNRCTLLRTTDAGANWASVFESGTAGTLCWKLDFPSTSVGYAAVQGTTVGPGTVARTRDGGATWEELPLTPSFYPAIGIGFLTEEIGWVVSDDAALPAYRTFDGGETWEVEPDLVGPINRFRVIDADTVSAVGGTVWQLEVPAGG